MIDQLPWLSSILLRKQCVSWLKGHGVQGLSSVLLKPQWVYRFTNTENSVISLRFDNTVRVPSRLSSRIQQRIRTQISYVLINPSTQFSKNHLEKPLFDRSGRSMRCVRMPTFLRLISYFYVDILTSQRFLAFARLVCVLPNGRTQKLPGIFARNLEPSSKSKLISNAANAAWASIWNKVLLEEVVFRNPGEFVSQSRVIRSLLERRLSIMYVIRYKILVACQASTWRAKVKQS